jgi:tetratricopeptide (TPR) repeat protein
VDASSTASIETDLRTWARSLGDGHEQDDWKNALHLLAGGGWVYVLDNADDTELDIPPFIPESSDGTIIITSRNQAVGSLAQYRLQLGEMTEEEALSALMKAARREFPLPAEELESAGTLIKELGCLALAIVHVGAYCDQLSSVVGDKRHVFTFTRYLTRFNSNRAALMREAGPPTIDGYKRLGVYTTLDLSYEKLPQSAKDFFRLISNFHFADIPMEMLVAAAERRFSDPTPLIPRDETSISRLTALLGTDRSTSEYQTEAVIITLSSFSLVSTTFIDDLLFIRIHPLVHAWVRDKSPEGENYGSMATQVLTSCSIKSNINMYRYLVPHILERLKVNQSSSLHVNDQTAFGQLLMKMGQFSVAETLFLDALRSLRKIFMDETANTLWAVGELASIYRAQGRFSEAEKLELEVLEKQGKILGVDHLDTIKAAANLAETYSWQGRHNEAEKLRLEVIERWGKILGVDHPDTMTAASDLA